MRAPDVSPEKYRRIALVALVTQVAIVVSGAAVRLTGSGLGCSDWPTCEEDSLVAPVEYHALIEFTNRLFSAVVIATVIAAVVGALGRTPRRRDLVLLSWGLVAGVAAQIVIGGLSVLFHLSPPYVMAHFLVSMLLVADATVLHHRAKRPDGAVVTTGPPQVRRWAWATVGLAAGVIMAGTVVTGAGPHGGDPEVDRLPILVREATQVHAVLALALLACATVTAILAWRRPGMPGRVEFLLAAVVAQIAIGYTQYFTGVPAGLVAAHVLGACLVWIAALRLLLGTETETSTPVGAEPADREPALVGR